MNLLCIFGHRWNAWRTIRELSLADNHTPIAVCRQRSCKRCHKAESRPLRRRPATDTVQP